MGERSCTILADKQVQTGNSLYAVPGMLASLWAPETALDTFSVIGPEAVIAGVATGVKLASKATFAVSVSRYGLFRKSVSKVGAGSSELLANKALSQVRLAQEEFSVTSANAIKCLS